MTICQDHKQNFETLKRAFAAGDVALMECRVAATGEIVAAICTVQQGENGGVTIFPFATMINGNPFEILEPPDPDGGFCHTPIPQGVYYVTEQDNFYSRYDGSGMGPEFYNRWRARAGEFPGKPYDAGQHGRVLDISE